MGIRFTMSYTIKSFLWISQLMTFIANVLCVCVLVTQSCPTLYDSMDGSSPGSSVQGIL